MPALKTSPSKSTFAQMGLFPLLLFLGCASCSSKSQGEDASEPSFLRSEVWLAGVAAQGSRALQVNSYRVEVAGCSKTGDDRTIDVENGGQEKQGNLANLTEGSTGCQFSLHAFTMGAEASETYLPKSGTPLVAAAGASALFVSQESGGEAMVVVEKNPGDPLGHFERLSFSVMPALGENRIPAWVSLLDIPGNSPVPKLLLEEVSQEGFLEGTQRRRIYFFLECESLRDFETCEGQNLLDMRFVTIEKPAGTPTPEGAREAFRTPGALIIPEYNHFFRNGMRFYLVLPEAAEGGAMQQVGFFIANGDSYRYFSVDLSQALPP